VLYKCEVFSVRVNILSDIFFKAQVFFVPKISGISGVVAGLQKFLCIVFLQIVLFSTAIGASCFVFGSKVAADSDRIDQLVKYVLVEMWVLLMNDLIYQAYLLRQHIFTM
jgi:hypothetical protein